MARFCSKCNRKIGFFEEDFEGVCKSCYEENLKQEEIRKEQEELRKKELEERKELERLEKLENQRKKEEQQRKLEEEKKKNEEERKEQETKYRNFKSKYFTNAEALKLYLDIIESLKKRPIVTLANEDSQRNWIVDDFEIIIKNIIYILPQDFKLNELQRVNNLQCFYEIIEKNRKNFGIDTLLTDEEYGNMYTEAFDEIKKQEREKKIVCKNEYKIYLSRDKIDLDSDIFDKYLEINEISDYYALRGELNSRKLIYYWVLIYIYNIITYQYKFTFEKSELGTMFSNLMKNTDDIEYILEKIYDIYIKLYKNLFDTELSKDDMKSICILCIGDLGEHIKDIVRIDNQAIKEVVENNNKIEFVAICKYIFSNEFTLSMLEYVLSNYEDMQLFSLNILCFIFERLPFLGHIEDLLFNDIIFYQKNIIDTINELIEEKREEKELLEAQKERDRLLNGDFSKELEKEKQEVEYSNIQNGYEFEEYVANLYKKLGYTIEEVTKKSGDQGADVIAYKDNMKYVIQVKFYSNPVGNKAVQEVVGAIGMYKADKGIVVTNNSFTPSAVELAQANNIELVDGEQIEKYKKKIIDNFSINDEEITEEYIEEIDDKWNELIEQKQFTQIDSTNSSEVFSLLAEVYFEKEQDDEYVDERIEKFIEAFSKYTKLGNDVYIQDRDDKEDIELSIRLALYKVHFMKAIEDILNDNTIDEEEKKKNIFYEYILDNLQDICITYKMLVLSKILNISNENILDEIFYYKEMFENGDGAEYLCSKTQKIIANTSQLLEELKENGEI